MKQKRTPEVCPVCDEDVPRNAKACPKCGACHESGWKEEADDEGDDEIDYDALDLPDEAYEGDEEREEARRRQGERQAIRPFWRWVALLVLVLAVLFSVLGPQVNPLWKAYWEKELWKWLGW